ncbi:MAG: amidohydrolase family protein [Thermodesulfobacteriota bacterium]
MSAAPAPVIDLHCHAAGIGAGGSGCRVSDRLRRSPRFRVYLRAYGVTEEELRREGDALVISRLAQRLAASREVSGAVVLALDGAVDAWGRLDETATEVYVPDRFVAEETARCPNLFFGASVNPLRRDALERLDEAAARGAVLVKWLPPIQGIDPADPRHAAFYRRLAELGLPLLSHTGTERSFTRSRDDLGDPERLRLPLRLGVTVVAAHGAAAGSTDRHPNFRRLAALAREHPNLWADVSSLTQVNHPGALARLLGEPAFRGRLLYGTDMPLIATSLVTPWFFAPRLGLAKARELARIPNPWDRDVALKRALGVPQVVFEAPARLLPLP